MQDFRKVLLLLSVLALSACSGDTFTANSLAGGGGTAPGCDPTITTCTVNAAFLSLRLSKQQINSDGLDTTTVIATVLDTSRAAIEGVQVTFSANAGKLSSALLTTDANGEVTVDFSSDSADPSNQIATITATVTGVGVATIPVEIVGTTLTTTITNTSLQVLAGFASVVEPIVVTALDAAGQKIFNAALTFSIVNVTGTASVIVSTPAAVTDTRGEVNLTLTASGVGTVRFLAQGLGTQAFVDLTVADLNVGNPFRITTPAADPASMFSGAPIVPLTFVASAVGVANVRFTTSIGNWAGTGSSITVAGGAAATADLEAPAGANGFATIVASDAANPAVFDTFTVAMSPPIVSADTGIVSIQTDVKVLPLSIGSSTFQANIEATVRTDNASGNFPILGVPVVFSISNSPGGGEKLTSSFGITDINGIVKTSFISGILPSGASAVQVTATIIPVGAPVPIPSDNINITLGGVGGSVAIGDGTLIRVDDDNSAKYAADMSVQVADSNGNPVAGAQVTMSIWPDSYNTGAWYDQDPEPSSVRCLPFISGPTIRNEDLDEDLILDNPGLPASEDVNLDLILTPPNSAAGTAPTPVLTDDLGIGFFPLTYLKQFSVWVNARVRGTAKVQGTETTGQLTLGLGYVLLEGNDCLLPNSPYPLLLSASLANLAFPSQNFGTGTVPGVNGVTHLIPIFEGNNVPVWSSAQGATLTIGAQATYTANSGIPRTPTNTPGVSYYDDAITIAVDPVSCPVTGCSKITVNYPIRVFYFP